MFPLPPSWTHEMGLPSKAGIPELWDTPVPVISGLFTDSVCSFLPHHGPGELVSVPRHCTGPYHFTIRPDGPGHGSRWRLGLTSRDFKDPGACLCHHTSCYACRPVGYLGYLFLSLAYGQEHYLIIVHLILLLLHHVKLWA